MAIPIKIIDKRSVPLAKLKNWDKNPRSITKENFERLKQQISRLGVHTPLLVNEELIVLSGNMRLRAYRELNIDPIDVWVVEARDEATMLEYALSANDHMGNTEEESLAELLMSLPSVDQNLFHVEVGQSIPLHELANRFGPDDSEEDEAPALSDEPAISQVGRVYQLGRHRLLCGDAVLSESYDLLLKGQKANMVFTDPPYNVDYSGGMGSDGENVRAKIINDKMTDDEFFSFLREVTANLIKHVFGAFYICMSSTQLHSLQRAFVEGGGHFQTFIIWAKDSFTLSRSDYQSQYEPIMHGLSEEPPAEVDPETSPILYGWTDHKWYGGRKQGNVWKIDRPTRSPDHPTMKPIALCAKAIKNSSKPGDLVLDVFGGSGSTLIAAEQTGRTCYMMELDPRYCDVIRKRYANFLGKENWQAETSELN